LEDELVSEFETESTDNDTDKQPTIVVAEGAFDSVAVHTESETEEWQSIKKLCL
jgi:hypothetical protein